MKSDISVLLQSATLAVFWGTQSALCSYGAQIVPICNWYHTIIFILRSAILVRVIL